MHAGEERLDVGTFLYAEARNDSLIGVDFPDTLHQAPPIVILLPQTQRVAGLDVQLVGQRWCERPDNSDETGEAFRY